MQWFPARFAGMYPYMKTQNWLYNYRTTWGIAKSFGGLVHRSAYMSESGTAVQLFETHYQLLQECYRHFWASLKAFARLEFETLVDPGSSRLNRQPD